MIVYEGAPGHQASEQPGNALWRQIGRFRESMQAHGEFEVRRRAQSVDWMWEIIEYRLREHFRSNAAVQRELRVLTEAVQQGSVAATVAARHLLALAAIN